MDHSLNDHLTPELLAQLEDKSDEAKIAKINKIIGHINEDTDDPEVIYAAGIGHYFRGEYEKCMEVEESVLHFFDDEMGIATIFWHMLAAWRCGKSPSLLLNNYRAGMIVGHHKSYNKICALANGTLSLESASLIYDKMFRPLDASIFGYGLSCYMEHIGRHEDAKLILNKVTENQDFWITYCYLAAWNDKRKEEGIAL